MKKAYVFPGQGAQFSGMGKDLYDNVPQAKELFDKANEILGFDITEIMFNGTAEELKQTKVTQPAVFLHSVILAQSLGIEPDATAGHSLGEFSALVAAGALSFEDGLRLVAKRAEADKPAYMMLAEIAEKYLYEPDSPLCDDNLYMIFLEEILRSPILDEYEKIRPAYQLNTARKNRTGSTAADFSYVGRDGRRRTLHDTVGESVLLVFYDPECEHCMEVMASLRDDGAIGAAVSGGRFAVVAVFADGDRESWKRLPDVIPDEWTDALDTTGVQERELYSFKQLPALYLLDEEKRVLLKECDRRTLSQSLVQRFQNPSVGSVDNRVLQ